MCRPNRSIPLITLAASLIAAAGCDVPITEFRPNEVYQISLAKSRATSTDQAAADAAAVVEAWFGTPETPRWPVEVVSDDASATLVDLENLVRAAGDVRSDQEDRHFGLYREHCVTCHGLEGSGAGPAALFQNPYPRDLRRGIFKWKSTRRTAKPTRDDLANLLHNGVRGAAMPSFAAIDAEDRDALVDYTIYLSIRGETERSLMALAVDELGYGEDVMEDEWRLAPVAGTQGGEASIEVLGETVRQWVIADQEIVEVPEFESLTGDALAESIERGRKTFESSITNCVACHGTGGGGGIEMLDYDDWTKEYTTRIGITPTDRDAVRPLRKAGALPPRVAEARNLRDGVYRGGGDPKTLYRRITQGIAGTPMPALEVRESDDGIGVTEAKVWDLVRYVRSLHES